MDSTLWWYFWTLCIAVAGAGFFGIALVVLIRGYGDIRMLIAVLNERRDGSE